MSVCAICEQPAKDGMNRVGGSDVCERCMRGLAPYVIREQRGWEFTIKQWNTTKDDGEMVYYTDASLRFAKSRSLSNFRGTSDLELPYPSSQFRTLALLGLNL